MKKPILYLIAIFIFLSSGAQVLRSEMLQDLEKNQQSTQDQLVTATLTSATRLFGEKDDLTSVIMIIPSGSTVDILNGDSTYFYVAFEDSEGFIFRSHAKIDETPVVIPEPVNQQQFQHQEEPQPQQQQVSRFTYLENKYGSSMAAKLAAGKIWKGMTAQMVLDSWGTPQKINRSSNSNLAREEWIYRNTWLYIENNTLVEWGPIQR
jgi:hypothetical protein